MNPQQIKDTIAAISEALKPLAEKMGVASETVFSWAIKANYAYAASWFLGFILASVLFFWPYCKLLKYGLNLTDKEKWYEEWVPVIILGVALVAACGITAVGFLTQSVPRLIAPEWYTLRDILDAIK